MPKGRDCWRRFGSCQQKFNKMSIEFYYIGCNRPIVLSSQLLEVDKIFRSKTSSNMSILSSLPKRTSHAKKPSSGKSPWAPSRNSNKNENAKRKSRITLPQLPTILNHPPRNPFSNWSKRGADSPPFVSDSSFKRRSFSPFLQNQITDISTPTKPLFICLTIPITQCQ